VWQIPHQGGVEVDGGQFKEGKQKRIPTKKSEEPKIIYTIFGENLS